ncbi:MULTISPECIES: hypothetical protein [Serratia]|uniref:hypothetical protein n=1 Tax=Serratia TaxID=613 RepID=UPI00093B48B4|nr:MULTISPECIES: hypothetical protein [Serratia]MDQ7098787.1 hypothetical protein [Serratia sp. MF2]MDQ7102368.1 hypothetical protein [Serratia sp. MF1(2023)]OKP31875.1 hypothetical protein BST62_15235 [Serratia marcescens]HCB3601857.1 hypothetical protein [Serratia marcescens]
MKELTHIEVEQVSGAGAIADAGQALGQGIGAIVQATGVKGAAEAGAALGKGIGSVVEVGINALGTLFGGLFGSNKNA